MRLVLVMLVACQAATPPPLGSTKPDASLFVEVPLGDAAPGLSGLAVDGDGGLWAVAERSRVAHRITFDAARTPRVETFAVEGIPPDTDLEGIAWLGGDLFVFGTEGHDVGSASVLYGKRGGGKLVVDGAMTMLLTSGDAGIAIGANHGAEASAPCRPRAASHGGTSSRSRPPASRAASAGRRSWSSTAHPSRAAIACG